MKGKHLLQPGHLPICKPGVPMEVTPGKEALSTWTPAVSDWMQRASALGDLMRDALAQERAALDDFAKYKTLPSKKGRKKAKCRPECLAIYKALFKISWNNGFFGRGNHGNKLYWATMATFSMAEGQLSPRDRNFFISQMNEASLGRVGWARWLGVSLMWWHWQRKKDTYWYSDDSPAIYLVREELFAALQGHSRPVAKEVLGRLKDRRKAGCPPMTEGELAAYRHIRAVEYPGREVAWITLPTVKTILQGQPALFGSLKEALELSFRNLKDKGGYNLFDRGDKRGLLGGMKHLQL